MADWNAGGADGADWKEGGDDAAWNEGGFDNGVGAADEEPMQNTGGANDGDDTCRNCGQAGHFARECPEPRKPTGACFNCGEEGHNKADCPNPRVFKGTCRICSQEGHPAAECPDKPPEICKNCKGEGHKTIDCTENRKFDQNDVPDKLPEEAWDMMKKAAAEKDLEDFREAFNIYSKAMPMATFDEIEKKLREEGVKIYLIGLEREVGDCHILVNLQGKLNCKYVVGFYFSDKPQRSSLKERWPESAEENLQRLEEGGYPLDRGIPKCGNCGEMGHTARGCKEERTSIERVEVKCVNCEQPGHRARDCTEKRKDKFACRNCGQSGHNSRECPEPRSAEGVECKKCNEVGHFAKDCPQGGTTRTCRNCGEEGHISKECDKPRNMDNVTCRNCEEVGHFSRDCQKKKDWSKVQCSNCKQMGHTYRRCPQPAEDNANDYGGDATNGFGDSDNHAGGESGGFGNGAGDTAAADGAWSTGGPATGGNGW